jgi:NTP pyrophosphatase (non-canonical NTP hydrolase)
MIEALRNLQYNSAALINVPKALTASVGMSAEAGEFTEIVKKMVFQGKPLTEDNRFHMKRELGDIMFYWVMACDAIGFTPQEVIDENVDKLSSRYKAGFTVSESENREKADL